MASDEVALGQIVETVTHSAYWKEFAIFVIEDDAQNGPDSIDSHRTMGQNSYGAHQSAMMDWSDYDRITEDELNQILWHSIKGVESPMPAPVHRALPMSDGRTENDDEDGKR